MTDLPSGWVNATLGAITWPTTDRTVPDPGDCCPYLSMDGVKSDTGTITKLAASGHFRSIAPRVEPGYVLYGRLRPYLNKVAEATFSGYCSGEFICFSPKPWLTPRFLKYRLLAQDFVNFATSLNTGDRPRVKWEQIAGFEIALPPLAEQRRIVAALEEHSSHLAAGSVLLAKTLESMRQLRAAALREVVRGQIPNLSHESQSGTDYDTPNIENPSSRKGPWEIPESWSWYKIGELFEVFVGSTPKRSITANWVGDIPWVSSGEVAFNRISKTRETVSRAALGNSETRLHPPGTVLLAMIGEGKTRGQVAILDVAAAHNQNCASIRVSGTSVLPEYLYAVLEERYEQTRKLASGGSQPALNGSAVRSILVPTPPIVHQKIIVDHLEDLRAAEDRLRRAVLTGLRQSEILRRTILRDAFAGRLVPQDPNDEPASVLLERIEAERAAQPKVRRTRRSPKGPNHEQGSLL